MKKRIVLSGLLAAALTLSLTACGGDKMPEETPVPTPIQTSTPVPTPTPTPAPAAPKWGDQVFAKTFLLNQHFGGRNRAVDKAGVVEVNLFLKCDELFRLFHAVDITQKRKPKGLTFPFFVALIFPVGGKFLCGLLLLCGSHSGHLIAQCFVIIIA